LTEQIGDYMLFRVSPPGARFVAYRPQTFPGVTDGLGIRSGGKRDEPSPRGVRRFRAWPDGVVDDAVLGGTMGCVLGRQDVRRLGGPALRLWRHLVDRRGYELRARLFSATATADLLRMAPRTLDRALARLKAAGLATADLRRVPRLALSGAVSWRTESWVTVLGAVDHDQDGDELLWVPDATLAWCAAAQGHGGLRIAGQRRGQVGETDAEVATTVCGLSRSSWRPKEEDKIHTLLSVVITTANPPLPGRSIFAVKVETPTVTAQPRPTRPPTTSLAPLRLRPDDSPESMVRMLVQSYNRAVREVFGDAGRRWTSLPSDPTRSKLYPRLKAAAETCLEHDVPPSAWALWALRLSKDIQTKRGKVPRPGVILTVFSAAYIARRRGWFRKSSEHSYGAQLHVGREHLEAMYRQRESRHPGALGFYPRWYVAVRQAEIGSGLLDPHAARQVAYAQVPTVKPVAPEDLAPRAPRPRGGSQGPSPVAYTPWVPEAIQSGRRRR
jgi:hypothetical protein